MVVATVLVCATQARVYAVPATENWSALDTNVFALADNTALPTNSVLWIGSFSINNSQIAAFQDNILGALTNFTLFGAGVIGGPGAADGVNGAFEIQSQNANPAFQNQQIYLLAFNVNPLFNVTNALQWAVVTSTNWLFPPDQLSTRNLDLESLQTIVVGSAGGPISDTTFGTLPLSTKLHMVPEPSAFILVGLGLAGVFCLRRGRK